MTDQKNDPYREHTSESGETTPGSDTSHGGHAEAGDTGGQTGQTGQSDQGGNTGALGSTGSAPDWMQAQKGKGGDSGRVAEETEKRFDSRS